MQHHVGFMVFEVGIHSLLFNRHKSQDYSLSLIFTDIQSGPDLDNVSQVAVSSQLQALPLSPGFNGHEPLMESSSPVVGAQAWNVGLQAHQLIEEPGTDKMEELGEELYSEGGVDPAAT